jgi:hypothetical protein
MTLCCKTQQKLLLIHIFVKIFFNPPFLMKIYLVGQAKDSRAPVPIARAWAVLPIVSFS